MPAERLRLEASIPFSTENLRALRGAVRAQAARKKLAAAATAVKVAKPRPQSA